MTADQQYPTKFELTVTIRHEVRPLGELLIAKCTYGEEQYGTMMHAEGDLPDLIGRVVAALMRKLPHFREMEAISPTEGN